MKNTISLTLLCLFSLNTLFAQDGTLDNSFGSGGIVTMDINNANDVMKSIVVQADGKIIVAGYSSDVTSDRFCLVRLNVDGTKDNSFGNNGVVTTAFNYTSLASDIALQSDGKIVVAGHTWNGTENAFAIVRYLSDGTLDVAFGNAGKVIVDFPSKNAVATTLRIQNDGKIITAGTVYVLSKNDFSEFAIVRLNNDGSLDANFGMNGRVTTSAGLGNRNGINSIAIQNDGKIVAGGFSDYFFTLARYHTNGSLDASFGINGLIKTSIPNATQGIINDIELAADGSIFAGGFSIDSLSDFTIAKYNSLGVLDNTYGTNGILVLPISAEQDGISDILLQADGKLLAAGSAVENGVFQFAITRLDNTGNPDASFGTNGVVKTLVNPNQNTLNAVTQQTDGKIVVVGDIGYNPSDIALARYTSTVLSTKDPLHHLYNVSIFPNPASNEININIASDRHGDVAIKLYDAQSSLLQEKNYSIIKGENKITAFNIEQYPKGIYFVNIEIGNYSKTFSVIKR